MKATAKKGERSIFIEDKIIEMPATIRHGLVFNDIFVVVLDCEYSMRNVFAFDENGNQVWQIEDPRFEMPGDGYVLLDGIGNVLMALCRGVQFYIDPKTGKIYDRYWDK